MTNVRHSTGSPKWGSPTQVIAIARRVLSVAKAMGIGGDQAHAGAVDVDPFSDEEFNRRVGADRFLDGTPGRDGYRDRWLLDDECPRADQLLAGLAKEPRSPTTWTAFVNPPNETDSLDAGEATKRAWRILEGYHRLGWLGGGGIWVAFNLNQLQTLQLGGRVRSPLYGGLLRCVPDRRLGFTRHSSDVQRDKETIDQPSHPMLFVLLPSTNPVVAAEQARLFDSMGSELGEVF